LHLLEKTVRKGHLFGKDDLPVAIGENPSGVCHNSAKTFPGAVLKNKG
jgi:hypothetical protein